jgi:NAD(P)-dependent dehydrogenase (short-subunit alcohol dehydrogenase family)
MQTGLITGATRGIGLEVARQLAREGMRVLAGARDAERGRAAAASMHGELEVVELDVASPVSIAACAQSVRSPLDLLVNNAGVYRSPAAEVWAVNVRGPILLTRALAEALAPQARIVNVTSGLGRISSQPANLQKKLADPTLAINDLLALPPAGYGESKAVLNAFTRLLAREWPARVVNSVSPGWVKTDMGGAGAPRELHEGVESVLYCCRLPPGSPSGRVYMEPVFTGDSELGKPRLHRLLRLDDDLRGHRPAEPARANPSPARPPPPSTAQA